MTAKTILVVDDDLNTRQIIGAFLIKEGFRVIEAGLGQTGFDLALKEKPDLIILDIMLPDLDGIEVCRLLRTKLTTPVFILSAKDEEIDKLIGLGVGADDYLTKPFSLRELVAKIKAMFRRINFLKASEVFQNLSSEVTGSEFNINTLSREVRFKGKLISLTNKEFELLKVLHDHPNQVFSRDQLLDLVWNEHAAIETNTVSVHIQKLREKLSKAGANEDLIKTVRGIGYKYE